MLFVGLKWLLVEMGWGGEGLTPIPRRSISVGRLIGLGRSCGLAMTTSCAAMMGFSCAGMGTVSEWAVCVEGWSGQCVGS